LLLHAVITARNLPTQVSLMLEDQGEGLVLGSLNADHHRAIRGKRVTFNGNRAGFGGRHLQDVVIPLGFTLEVFAAVNRGAVLGVGDVVVEEGLGCTCVYETGGDDDDSIPLVDRHGAGLNHGLAAKIALGGHQRPSTVQGAVVSPKGGEREQEGREDDPGNCSS
jgi:hypothetical protein